MGFAHIPTAIRPFRFQVYRLNHKKFHDFVCLNWVSTTPIIPFLKSFGDKIQKWNKEEFYNIFRKKHELWANLERIQNLLSKGRQTHLIKLEAKLRTKMKEVLNYEKNSLVPKISS